VYDPIVRGSPGEDLYGCFLKDYDAEQLVCRYLLEVPLPEIGGKDLVDVDEGSAEEDTRVGRGDDHVLIQRHGPRARAHRQTRLSSAMPSGIPQWSERTDDTVPDRPSTHVG